MVFICKEIILGISQEGSGFHVRYNPRFPLTRHHRILVLHHLCLAGMLLYHRYFRHLLGHHYLNQIAALFGYLGRRHWKDFRLLVGH